MFDPTIGRWLTQDPLAFEAGDADLYRYCGNDPTNAVDPTGLFWKELGNGIVAVGSAAGTGAVAVGQLVANGAGATAAGQWVLQPPASRRAQQLVTTTGVGQQPGGGTILPLAPSEKFPIPAFSQVFIIHPPDSGWLWYFVRWPWMGGVYDRNIESWERIATIVEEHNSDGTVPCIVISGHGSGSGAGIVTDVPNPARPGFNKHIDDETLTNPKTIARIKKKLAPNGFILILSCGGGVDNSVRAAHARRLAQLLGVPVFLQTGDCAGSCGATTWVRFDP